MNPKARRRSRKLSGRLIAEDKTYTEAFKLTMDPRVKTAPLDLQKQFARKQNFWKHCSVEIRRRVRFAACVSEKQAVTPQIEICPCRTRTFWSAPRRPRAKTSLSSVNAALLQLSTGIAEADAAPTSQQTNAAQKAFNQIEALLKQWNAIKSKLQASAR